LQILIGSCSAGSKWEQFVSWYSSWLEAGLSLLRMVQKTVMEWMWY